MAYYGVSAPSCKWFESFLTGRRQYVEIQTNKGEIVKSDIRTISRGTPQGSILSPLLFILYTADLLKHLEHCNAHLYADDTQIYHSFSPNNVSTALVQINKDLDMIADWSRRNNLVLNPTKSQFIVMGNKFQRAKIKEQNPRIEIGGELISQVENAKSLGIIMDEQLRYVDHVNMKIRNAFYRLKVLYGIRKYLTVKVREILTESLVLSQFNYADIVYGPRLLSVTKKSIQRVQNACVRFCYDIPKRSHITPYLNERKLLNMENRRKSHLAYTVRKVIEFQKPYYLFEKLKWVKDTQKRPLRPCTKLSIPHHKTAFYRGCFKFAAANLPPPLREPMTLFKFKKLLQKHLLTVQNIY